MKFLRRFKKIKMIKIGCNLVLSDGNKYTVLEIIEMNNNKYIFLVDINNPSNTFYGRLDKTDIVIVEDKKVLESLMLRTVKNINEILKNTK